MFRRRQKSPKRAAKMPKVTQKRQFWRARGPPFQAKTPIMTSCRNSNIYNGLGTFRRSQGIRLGTQKPTLKPSGPQRRFWDAFPAVRAARGAPKGRERTQKGSQRPPEGTQNAPQIRPKPAPGAPGVRKGSRGYPRTQNDPKVVRKLSEIAPEIVPKLT